MNQERFLKLFDIFPGLKTYSGFVTLAGMLICQGFGFHQFPNEAWGGVITATLTFWKMGQDRKPVPQANVPEASE